MGQFFAKSVPERLELAAFLLILGLMLSPVFQFSVFFTNDGPAHLYNSHILKEMLCGNGEPYASYFELNQIPEPNWTGHALLVLLLFVAKPLVAEKLLVTIYVVAFMFGFRYLIGAFKRKGLWTSYFGFLFVYNFPLYTGFFNFSLGLATVFFAVGFWLRHAHSLTKMRAVQFALLFLLCYFTHITTYAFALACIGLFELMRLTSSLNVKEVTVGAALRRYCILLLAALPSLVLAVVFFKIHGGEGINENMVPAEQQWRDLMTFRPINVYMLVTEEPISQFIFPATVVMFYLVAALGFFRYQHEDGGWRVRMTIRDGLSQLRHVFLLLSGLFLWAYFVLPDDLSSGGFVHVRLLLVFFIMVYLWLATARIPMVLGLPLVVLILVTNHGLLGRREEFAREQNTMVTEMRRAAEHIPQGSVVLPIIEHHHWFFSHVSNYLGIERPMIVLDNYEAATGYFPLNWRMSPNPNELLGRPIATTCGENVFLWENSYGPVDVVVHYFDGSINYGTSCQQTVEQLVAQGYAVTYTSATGHLKVYKKKGSDSGLSPTSTRP